MGITGAALATSAGMIVRSITHALLVRRHLGLRSFALLAEVRSV
jgi:hypothetical protein